MKKHTIVHLGLGAFHRAHQAAVIQRLHDAGDLDWRIVSGNIRPGEDIAPALLAQDNRYTLETVAPDGRRHYETISAIEQAIPYAPGIAALIETAAQAATRIISFTVTEAGYFLDAGDQLDLSAADIGADLAAARRGAAGTTIYGALAAMLRARIDRGAGPVTLLCCDNLRHNGTRFRLGMRQFLALLDDAALLRWFDSNTRCPNAMVDRITPRATAAARERVRTATGRPDPAAVTSESYLQWVIEDDFCAGRPAWESAGVAMVASVAPYEEAKIRILNASHSCIAWAGALAGYTNIDQAVRDRRIASLVRAYAGNAVFDCLRPSPVDLPAYLALVLARFACAAIEDSVERVAADSAAKLAGFIVPTIRERLARGLDIGCVAVLPALFAIFLQRLHAGAVQLAYRDPALTAVAASDDPAGALCALPAIWDELAGDRRLADSVRLQLAKLSDIFPENPGPATT